MFPNNCIINKTWSYMLEHLSGDICINLFGQTNN
jgi:hypothetical protein